MTVDGAVLRRKWDDICNTTVGELQRARQVARTVGPPHVLEALQRSITAVRMLQSAVDARRRPPGGPVASGLIRDAPADFADPPYRAAWDALSETSRFYESGMDVDWDWSQGFPPGWPRSWREWLLGGRAVTAR